MTRKFTLCQNTVEGSNTHPYMASFINQPGADIE